MKTKLLIISLMFCGLSYAQNYSNVPSGVRTDGLLAYYPFDNSGINNVMSTGTNFDLSEISNPNTPSGDTQVIEYLEVDAKRGRYVSIPRNKALSTIDFNNHFDTANPSTPNSFTIAFWMRARSAETQTLGSYRTYIEMFESFIFREIIGMYYISTTIGGFNSPSSPPNAIRFDRWEHYAFRFEEYNNPPLFTKNAYLTLLVNGQPRGGVEVDRFAIEKYSSEFLIGVGKLGGGSSDYNWDGKGASIDVDEMYIYSAPLSNAEIQQIRDATGSTLSTEVYKKEDFKVYPNPFQDEIQLNIPTTVQDAKASVYSLTGQLLIESKVSANEPKISNLGSLKSGVYILKVEVDSNQVLTYKLVK